MMNIPLTDTENAVVVVDFHDSLAIGLKSGDIELQNQGVNNDKERFFGMQINETGKAAWDSNTRRLTLRVASELSPCVLYSVTFKTINPLEVNSPSSPIILQEAENVQISATGSLGVMIVECKMVNSILLLVPNILVNSLMMK